MNEKVLILGLNPTWQRILQLPQLFPGSVNRLADVVCYPSGKGINVCRSLMIWERECHLVQFAGGSIGKTIVEIIEQEGIKNDTIWIDEETRTAQTILEKKHKKTTELIDPSPTITSEHWEKLLKIVKKIAGDYQMVIIAGSAPKGVNTENWVQLCEILHEKKIPILLDVALDSIFVDKHPLDYATHLKINRHELNKLVLNNGGSEVGIQELHERFPNIQTIGVTDGAGVAVWSNGKSMKNMMPPQEKQVVNPVGSGDVATATYAHFVLNGDVGWMAFWKAIKSATAAVAELKPGMFIRSE